MEKDAQVDFFVLTITGTNVAYNTDDTALHFDTHGTRDLTEPRPWQYGQSV